MEEKGNQLLSEFLKEYPNKKKLVLFIFTFAIIIAFLIATYIAYLGTIKPQDSSTLNTGFVPTTPELPVKPPVKSKVPRLLSSPNNKDTIKSNSVAVRFENLIIWVKPSLIDSTVFVDNHAVDSKYVNNVKVVKLPFGKRCCIKIGQCDTQCIMFDSSQLEIIYQCKRK